jgi:hypothetical protein
MASKSNNTRKRPRSSKKIDKYREQARRFIALYFNPKTPAIVRELLSQWYTQLESETQIFWNDKHVAEVAIPIMLREAARLGVDVEDKEGYFCMTAVRETYDYLKDCREHAEEKSSEPSEKQALQHQLMRDAEAIDRLINSGRTPERLRRAMCDALDEIQTGTHDNVDVLRASYPLAVMRERSASHEDK